MKHLLGSLGALTIAALLQLPTANAQSFITRDAGWYWRAEMGATIPQDGTITEFGQWSSGQKVSYDTGFGLDASFGYFFNRYLATEIEAGGTWNYINSVEGVSLHDT